MSRVVKRSRSMPVFSATAIQISGTRTPSRSVAIRVGLQDTRGSLFIRLKRLLVSPQPDAPRFNNCQFSGQLGEQFGLFKEAIKQLIDICSGRSTREM